MTCNLCGRKYVNLKSHIYRTQKHKNNSLISIQKYFRLFNTDKFYQIDIPYEICVIIFNHLPFTLRRSINFHNFTVNPMSLKLSCEVPLNGKICKNKVHKIRKIAKGGVWYCENGTRKRFFINDDAFVIDITGEKLYCCKEHYVLCYGKN